MPNITEKYCVSWGCTGGEWGSEPLIETDGVGLISQNSPEAKHAYEPYYFGTPGTVRVEFDVAAHSFSFTRSVINGAKGQRGAITGCDWMIFIQWKFQASRKKLNKNLVKPIKSRKFFRYLT